MNQEGVQFYRRMISCLREHGIRPVLNLYHFDMPLALQHQGGWENRHTVDAFVRYASFCFDTFGDLAKDWLTFNEPIVPVEGGYLYGFHYPAAVSYTHLDVYKRQVMAWSRFSGKAAARFPTILDASLLHEGSEDKI